MKAVASNASSHCCSDIIGKNQEIPAYPFETYATLLCIDVSLVAGNDSPGKDSGLPHTDAPTSRNCTAPNTPDELSPAMAASRQHGHTPKQDQTGAGKVDGVSNGKTLPLKTGKSHTKAAPLPPGFLESELQLYKRKLKLAELAIDTHRQELAASKRQLAAVTAESQELRMAKEALESCRAADEAQQHPAKEEGLNAGNYQWTLLGLSLLSVGAFAAVIAMRSTALQTQRHPSHR